MSLTAEEFTRKVKQAVGLDFLNLKARMTHIPLAGLGDLFVAQTTSDANGDGSLVLRMNVEEGPDRYFKIGSYYSSYDDRDWDEEFVEVRRKVVTKTVWEEVA